MVGETGGYEPFENRVELVERDLCAYNRKQGAEPARDQVTVSIRQQVYAQVCALKNGLLRCLLRVILEIKRSPWMFVRFGLFVKCSSQQQG